MKCQIEMNDFGFEIKTTLDFYKKLLEDYNEFCNDKTSSRVALNCVMTAWHLTEWSYNEFFHQLFPHFSTLASYQKEIKKECPSLQIMHDLANGTKHYRLTRHIPIIKETILHKGIFSSDFSRDFDVSTLDIELKDGKRIYFEDELSTTINFWNKYLQTNFNIVI